MITKGQGRHRTIGKTGISVFEVGFGSWAIGGNRTGWGYGPTNDRTSIRAVHEALAAGCDLFDTADCYGNGHSEYLLGKTLGSVRRKVYIATKGGYDFYHGTQMQNYAPSYLLFALHQSLRRLSTDYVDFYLLHNPPTNALLQEEVIEVLLSMKEGGKVRHIGISVSTVMDGLAAVHAGWPEIVQVPYSMLYPEAEVLLFPSAHARGIGIFAREPLANGYLSGKYGMDDRFGQRDIRNLWSKQHVSKVVSAVERIKPFRKPNESMVQLAMRFALESRLVSVVICGCKSPHQVIENFSESSVNVLTRLSQFAPKNDHF